MVIKNLIFDLGGVILDLSVPKTLEEFSRVSGLDHHQVTQRFKESKGFELYERGEFNDDQFRNFVRSLFNVSIDDKALDACWNAMLLGFPSAKLELLKTLKSGYKVFLLSNTNNIHLNYINSTLFPRSEHTPSLDSCFHKSYYSHLMGKRKPESEIFLQVLDENNIKAEETLFLDDNFDNIEGAKLANLQTAFVNTTNFILDYFND